MDKKVRYDLDSYDIVTKAIKSLINDYPKLGTDDEITFCTLSDSKGKSFFPVSGPVIQSETKDITGHVEQNCMYPFYVIYRASGLTQDNKIKVKEWLDSLGKWLEKQMISVGTDNYSIKEYPSLSGNRKFERIYRTSPSYLYTQSNDGVEDWAINLSAQYKNEYDTN